MSGASYASAILSILTVQNQSAGSELVARANTLGAFRNGILIITFSAVVLYTAVCSFSVLKLRQTQESDEDDASASEHIEIGNGSS